MVLAGIELDSISLGPRSAINVATNELVELINQAFSTELNRPLVLVDAQPSATLSFVARHGLVVLEDVAFKYLGAGKISVRKVVSSLGDLDQRPAQSQRGRTARQQRQFGWLWRRQRSADPDPAAHLVKAVLGLMQFAVEFGGAQFLQFESEDANVATVSNFDASITDPSLAACEWKSLRVFTAVTLDADLETPFANLGEKFDRRRYGRCPGWRSAN